MSKLKPCPFCEGYHLSNEGVTNKSIHCVDCGAYGPEPAYDDNEIDVDWNTRAAPKVKALEWEMYPDKDANVKAKSVTPLGTYFICDDNDDFTGLFCDLVKIGEAEWFGSGKIKMENIFDGLHYDDVDLEKHVFPLAQSHYEKQILEALE